MYVKKVTLNNFRNYSNQEIKFSDNINVIYGNNAQGKTNILEAIFLCSMGKSFRAKKDKELIKFDSDSAKVEVEYERIDRCGKIRGEIADKKTFFVNDVKQTKISDIIGKINVIIFTPDNIEIVKGSPQKRRKFLDMMVSSLKPNYIHLLNNYNRALEQRNNYLRQIKFENKDKNLLDVWDEQLAQISEEIFKYRNTYMQKFQEKIKVIHKTITKCGKPEDIEIRYIHSGKEKQEFLDNLKKSREIDIKRGFTATGVHRDDFIIYIDKRPISTFGSQGQQRTAILTLKLTELEIVKEEIGESPVLLLDDFMSELDEKRRISLLDNIKGNQVIITCTDKIENINEEMKTIYIESGIAHQN